MIEREDEMMSKVPNDPRENGNMGPHDPYLLPSRYFKGEFLLRVF